LLGVGALLRYGVEALLRVVGSIVDAHWEQESIVDSGSIIGRSSSIVGSRSIVGGRSSSSQNSANGITGRRISSEDNWGRSCSIARGVDQVQCSGLEH